MIITNYHTHSNYCHGEGNIELYVQKAIEMNMYAIGFSSHAPVPFVSDWHMKKSQQQNYIEEILFLKNNYREKIKIYLGFEVDYIQNIITPTDFRKESVDYLIGSVHYVGKFENGENNCIDNTTEQYEKGLRVIYNNDIKKLVEAYYKNIISMVENYPPDIIGHLDLIKKLNHNSRYFNEEDSWYRKIVEGVLEVISNSNCVVEINTRGYYKGITKEFYPSKWILSECLKYNIPIVISTDAHNPDEINRYFTEAVSLLIDIGYESISILDGNKWNKVKLVQV